MNVSAQFWYFLKTALVPLCHLAGPLRSDFWKRLEGGNASSAIWKKLRDVTCAILHFAISKIGKSGRSNTDSTFKALSRKVTTGYTTCFLVFLHGNLISNHTTSTTTELWGITPGANRNVCFYEPKMWLLAHFDTFWPFFFQTFWFFWVTLSPLIKIEHFQT